MNSGRGWRLVNPVEFNDGVLYLPAMTEIQPRYPDWGISNMSEMRARIMEDRPHSANEENGKLLCLKCMAITARNGGEAAPTWMYYKQQGSLSLFCHCGGGRNYVHEEHMPVSDEHKALVEREVRICEQVGASVETEVRAAGGRRRADFIAVGPEVSLAGEVQLSVETRSRIGRRQRDLSRDGNRVLWTTHNVDHKFLLGVPRLVIPALTGWQQARESPELAIVAGLTLVEYQRCGWADLWSGTNRCPVSGSPRPCGKMHAYPTANINERTYRPSGGPLGRVGIGRRPHLDYLVAGIVLGKWLPYERTVRASRQFVWMPAEDFDHVREERGGGDLEIAERSAGLEPAGNTKAAKRTCESRGDDGSSRTIIDLKTTLIGRSGKVLAWAGNAVGDMQPCRYCGGSAFLRDEMGRPAHKVCAEEHLSDD